MGAPLGPRRHARSAWAGLAVAAIVLVGGVVALLGGGGDPGPASAAPKPIVAGTTRYTAEAATALANVKRVSDAPLVESGRPVVFFMGAHFCPFCAAERWALVEATSRFGTWSNLRPLEVRGEGEGFGSLPTYDLSNARSRSAFLNLRHKEVADRDGKRLQSLDALERRLVDAYNPNGSIPFIAAGGKPGQFTVKLAYSPSLIQGQRFDALRRDVATGAGTPAVKAITGEADAITALLCKLTAGKPVRACSPPQITALADQVG